VFGWMQRRQAANDLNRIKALAALERTQVAFAASVTWEVIAETYGYSRVDPVESLAVDASAPIQVSGVRIKAAAGSASDLQLLALSLWQSTARAAQPGAGAELVASVCGIWNLLQAADHEDEHYLTELGRELAKSCFNSLSDIQRKS
jgi:hypothetical protein